MITKMLTFKSSLCFIKNMPRYNYGHVIGQKYDNPITISTSELFQNMVNKSPQSILINSFSQNITFTYQQAYKKAQQLATGLIKRYKLKPKDRIGVYAYNKWQWFITHMAAGIADLILVNINPAYQSQELAYTIDKVGLKVLFLSDKFRHLDYLGIVRQVVPEMEVQNQHALESKRFGELRSIVRFNVGDERVKGTVNFSDLLGQSQPSLFPPKIDPHNPANIQFTSGTTGLPKAATLSHYNILNNGYQIGNNCKYTQKDNIAVPVPFYHCFGNIMGSLGALTRGASITVVCQGFDAKKTLEAIHRYGCTSVYGVPTMFLEYLRVFQNADVGTYDVQKLRTGIIAGSICPEILMQKILNVLKIKDVTNCYGMTQTSPVSFQTSPTDPFQKITTTVGRVLPGLQAKVVNEQGQLCKPGQSGQFIVKGWAVMKGYWQDKKSTQNSIIDGWMKSGDLATLDQNGYLAIVGRIKDMIIRGGQNIYPKQIEEYLNKIQGVIDVQVVSVSDEKYGEEIAAVIKVKDVENNKLNKDSVFEFCYDKIAFYKIPKYVKFVAQYPLTVSGKVQKYILRDKFQEQKKNGQIEKYVLKKIK